MSYLSGTPDRRKSLYISCVWNLSGKVAGPQVCMHAFLRTEVVDFIVTRDFYFCTSAPFFCFSQLFDLLLIEFLAKFAVWGYACERVFCLEFSRHIESLEFLAGSPFGAGANRPARWRGNPADCMQHGGHSVLVWFTRVLGQFYRRVAFFSLSDVA